MFHFLGKNHIQGFCVLIFFKLFYYDLLDSLSSSVFFFFLLISLILR